MESRTTDTEKGGQSRDASTRPNGQGNQQSSGGHNFRFQILFCAALCTYTLTNWINLAQVDAGSQQDSNALMSQVLRVQVWTELFSLTSVDMCMLSFTHIALVVWIARAIVVGADGRFVELLRRWHVHGHLGNILQGAMVLVIVIKSVAFAVLMPDYLRTQGMLALISLTLGFLFLSLIVPLVVIITISLSAHLRQNKQALSGAANNDAIKAVIRLAVACLTGAGGVLLFIIMAFVDLSSYSIGSIATSRTPADYAGTYVPSGYTLGFTNVFVNTWLGAVCSAPFLFQRQSIDAIRAFVSWSKK